METLLKLPEAQEEAVSDSTSKSIKNPLLSLSEWLSIENVLLFWVCIADMLTTLYWVHKGIAVEANPIFAIWLAKGDGAFVCMKLISFMPLIAVSTYYKRSRPRLITNAMRFTIAVYISAYFGRMIYEVIMLYRQGL